MAIDNLIFLESIWISGGFNNNLFLIVLANFYTPILLNIFSIRHII